MPPTCPGAWDRDEVASCAPLAADKARSPCSALQTFRVACLLCCLKHLCLNRLSPPWGQAGQHPRGLFIQRLLGAPGHCLSQSNTEKGHCLQPTDANPCNPTECDLETGAQQAAGVRGKPRRDHRGLGKGHFKP